MATRSLSVFVFGSCYDNNIFSKKLQMRGSINLFGQQDLKWRLSTRNLLPSFFIHIYLTLYVICFQTDIINLLSIAIAQSIWTTYI